MEMMGISLYVFMVWSIIVTVYFAVKVLPFPMVRIPSFFG